jgi:hypothetical protein
MKKDSMTNAAEESPVNEYGVLYEEVFSTLNRNPVLCVIPTPVVIFLYEQENSRDKIHIELLESVKHIALQQIASDLFVRNIPNNPDSRWEF